MTSTTPASKKYKLVSASALIHNPGVRPVCAFFGTVQGCRKGNQCPFRHEGLSDDDNNNNNNNNVAVEEPQRQRQLATTAPVSDSSSVVSSESEGNIREATVVPNPFVLPSTGGAAASSLNVQDTTGHQPAKSGTTESSQPQALDTAATTTSNKKRKRNKKPSSTASNVFAKPKNQLVAALPALPPTPAALTAPSVNPPSYASLARTNAVISTNAIASFASLDRTNAVTAYSEIESKNENVRSEKKQRLSDDHNTTTPTQNEGNFRSLILPITPFSTAAAADNGKKSTKASTPSPATKPEAVAKKPLPEPLPTSTEVGRQWQELVVKTRQHATYNKLFDFARYQEMEEESGMGGRFAWIKAKPYGSWCADHPAIIALDCEMCETQDPVSGARDSKALCRVSIVNGENPSEVLLDTVVKPSWPISDYRTRWHGIAPDDMEPVQCTLRHVQAFLMALCCDETIIVGHAVHNDLMALKMEHYCVVDSSFLFPVKDSATASASLKTLASTFLDKDMPTVHDSVLDARTAFDCVQYYREHQGNVKPVDRTSHKSGGSNSEISKQLLVHRIPRPCLPVHLEQMFLEHTLIRPVQVPDIEFIGDTGKAIITFMTSRHCNLSFDTLQGNAEADNSGRAQKKVYLRSGSYVRVRKMAFEKVLHGPPLKKKYADDSNSH